MTGMSAEEHFHAGFYVAGRRLVVRDTPDNAVRVLAGWFGRQGFWPFADANAVLRQEGSPWVAQAMVIGTRASFGRKLVYWLMDETPLAVLSLLPFVKRNIPPTLVMIAARWLTDESCELLVDSHEAGGIFEDESLAAPRVEAAIQTTIEAYRAAGRLIETGRLKTEDKNCPVFVTRIVELTGWSEDAFANWLHRRKSR